MTNMSLQMSCIAESPPEFSACAAVILGPEQRNTGEIELNGTRYEEHSCPFVQSLFRGTTQGSSFQSGEPFVSLKHQLSLSSKGST